MAWLQAHLGRPDALVLDASPTPRHRKGHIPGAVNADLLPYATHAGTAGMEERFQSWGVDPGLTNVIVDEGGTYQAARLLWDMVQHGLPAQRLFILDGGMAKWHEAGAAVTQEPKPPRAPGTVRLSALNPDVRVYLPEFLAATANPARHVMLVALDPDYFSGGAGFFNRPGHVPHATLMPSDDLFNADKTFKSPAEMRRMFQHLGVKPDREVLTSCGGGGAVLALPVLDSLGQQRLSMQFDSIERWADAGHDIARPAAVTTPAGGATAPAAPKPYAARPRQGEVWAPT